MMAASPTRAQRAALKWLVNRGGEAVFDKTQCLIARGERAGVSRSTWARLSANGLVEIYRPQGASGKRCRVTGDGLAVKLNGIAEAGCREKGQ